MATTWMARLRHAGRVVTESSIVRPRTEEDHNARLLYLNTAMVGVASGGIVAFLPVFLARLGAGSTALSWLASAPALLAMLFLIPGAVIAERNPDQVQVRVTSTRIVRGSYLLCALAPWVVPVEALPLVLIVIWTLKTFPETVMVPSWTAVMARAVSPRRRATLNGTRWALLSVVSAASSAIFGWMLDRIAFPLNYQLVFLISFFLSALDPFFFAKIRVPPFETPVMERTRPMGQRLLEYFRPVLRHRPFLLYLAATILYRVTLNLPSPLFSLFWVNELGAPDTLIGLRSSVGHCALVVGYILWGRSANRLGHRRVLWLGALGLGLYPVLTALVPSAGWLLPVAALWGVMASAVDIGLFDLMLGSCPDERQTLFAAVWSMAANAAVFMGPLLGASLANATTVATALIVAGIAQAVATLPFVALPHDV